MLEEYFSEIYFKPIFDIKSESITGVFFFYRVHSKILVFFLQSFQNLRKVHQWGQLSRHLLAHS